MFAVSASSAAADTALDAFFGSCVGVTRLTLWVEAYVVMLAHPSTLMESMEAGVTVEILALEALAGGDLVGTLGADVARE